MPVQEALWGGKGALATQRSRALALPPGRCLGYCSPAAPSAGYQGSFHSIQSCFPYGDCYRVAEPAASGDALAGEASGFNPLRPNGYHGLSAPLPATGKPHLHGSLPRRPTRAQPCAGCLMPIVPSLWDSPRGRVVPLCRGEIEAQGGPRTHRMGTCALPGPKSVPPQPRSCPDSGRFLKMQKNQTGAHSSRCSL